MGTVKATFAAAVLLPIAYVLYVVSDLIPLWARHFMALAGMGVRVCGGLVVLLVLIACLWLLLWQAHERNRQRDGAFALREYWLEPWPKRFANWLIGKPSARAIYDPNANMSHAAVIAGAVFAVEPAAGWDRQLAYQQDIERTRRAQAAVPGDGVMSLPWSNVGRGGVANAPTGRFLAGAYDKAIKPPVTIDAPPAVPQLPPPAPRTAPEIVGSSRPSAPALGETTGGEIVRWDMATAPHLSFHGQTRGAGKTNAIQTIAAGALRTGAHVVVFDPAHHKDWGEFAHCAELVDAAEPAALADGAARLLTIYHNRTRQLAATGARDVTQMARPPQRIVVVICEFGAQCELARAEGVIADVETPLLQLARKAGAAGVHLVFEDQVMEHWPRAMSGNTTKAIGRMPLYAAQACGFVPRRGISTETLERGEFWFGGQLVRTPDMQPVLRALLSDVPAPRHMVMLTPPWVGVRSASETEGDGGAGGVRPEVANERTNERTPVEPVGPTDLQAAVWAWRDAHPNGTQAEMRREFEARGIDIARGYAHECWHKWPGPNGKLDLSTDAGRAAFAALAKDARLPNGAKLGTDITGGE